MGLLRVLLVEDSPTDAKLVTHALRATGHTLEVERVEEAQALLDALGRQRWDLVLSDWSMPRFSALGALEIVNAHGGDVPFIIVSGTIGEEAAVDAMRAGAHDYVIKDKLARLAPAVERELREAALRRERRRVDERLRASEMRFSRLAESGIIGIVVAEIPGTTLEVNDACVEMLGYSREALLSGRVRWADITPPEWRALDAAALEQLTVTGLARPWEKELIHKDGRRVPVLVGVAMLDAPRCITFVADLSERNRARDALRESEHQLRQAQKMEAVGRLAGSVAHDFNNVLSVILSYCDMLLLDLPPADPVACDVEEIKKAGRRAADLTSQLLTFSRHERMDLKVIDIAPVFEDMEKMLRRLVGEDVDLVFVKSKSRGRVRADVGSIEQVLMNLVVNARDAMPQGGKLTLEIADIELDEAYAIAHHGVKAGAYTMLAVSDDGVGMDPATQARIFEPFFTTKAHGKGTGLGLSTVFGIVHQCGGHVWVYSEVGRGTTFKVYFPRVDAALHRAKATIPPTNLIGSETILLVEDEEQVRAVARGILQRHGYVVIAASNAGEAYLLSETHDGPIDLLLTDVVMPQMSGPALARRLATARPEMKVLCMSGYTNDAALRHGLVDAEVGYLQKPLTVESLTLKVREVLDAIPVGSSAY